MTALDALSPISNLSFDDEVAPQVRRRTLAV
jgi:hypothetical protein